MKLYYMPGACPLAPHIALEWVGADYETERLSHADLKTPEFLAINPMGAVPALKVGDTVLTQNAGILAYLAGSYPAAKLDGDGNAMSRAQVYSWFGFVNSDIHAAYKPLFGATGFLGDEAMVAKTHDNAREKLRAMFEIVDRQLQDNDWIAGERSIADPYLYVLIRWTDVANVDLSGLEGIARFCARMEADEGVQRALAAQGLA